MLTAYLQAAMERVCVERMEDGRYFAHVEDLKGPWADGDTEQACRANFRQVLEEWLVAALRDDEELPAFGGVDLNFGGRRWSAQPAVASSSAS